MAALFAPLVLAQAAEDAALAAACGDGPGIVCRLIYNATGNETLARGIEWVVNKPLKIILILALAWLLVTVLKRIIRRLVDRLVTQRDEQAARRRQELAEETAGARHHRSRAGERRLAEQTERGRQRAQALGTVLRSLTSAIIWSLAVLIVLGEFGVNLGPLIAGAGIAGIALGFGAQTLVRDFLSGVFMLAEDQYGVGDVVDLGDAKGAVEEIRLRTTRLRDNDGTVWYVPNGEIRRVANKSQRWARAVLDIDVAADTDLDLATRVIKEAADAIWHEQPVDATILEEPEVLGIESFGEASVRLRLTLKVDPGEQWSAARLARRRVKDALDAAGIDGPLPQQVVWLRPAAGPAVD